jgi:hypothetical protein
MIEAYWVVTYEEKLHKGKPVLDEQSKPRIDSITIGPFFDEQKARDYADKNIRIHHKFFKCSERTRDKATKAIKEGKAEEV